MKPVIFLVAIFSVSSAWLFSKPESPEWHKLSVTFGKFNSLPISKSEAEKEGWKLTSACGAKSSFSGNRYVLNDDTAVMLLMDSKGKIAGIQAGVPTAKALGPIKAPWVKEGDMYVITVYFVDPATICSGTRPKSAYIGDRLLLQTGSSASQNVRIPFKEEDLAGTKWVAGQCFYLMGQHYWYNISAGMNCDDFFPMFIMYNKKRLNAFGWDLNADLTSKRYEHPTWDKLNWFFKPETKPQCLKDAKVLSTQHIYLDSAWNNFC